MVWNKEEHPRKEDGKFTYKNQGVSSTPNISREEMAHTLYAGTRKQKEEKEQTQRKRNELINILGDKVTSADILLRTPEELEKRIEQERLNEGKIQKSKASNLQQKSKDRNIFGSISDKFYQKKAEIGLGTLYSGELNVPFDKKN